MKYLFLSVAFTLSSFASATIITNDEGKITSIYTYDDYKEGTVFIHLSKPIGACPNGAYLNPNSPGVERLYSIALAVLMSDKNVRFQLYDDRVIDGRCEVDAIRVSAN